MLLDNFNAREKVEVTSPLHRLAHRLKAIVFINQLIFLAGTSRTPAALECWGVAFEERMKLIGPGGGEPGKWKNYLSGVLPKGELRSALINEFPSLEEVLHNPLWEILRLLEVPSDYVKTLVAQLRLDGKPLHGLHRVRLQRRISTAVWRDLWIWLVILACDLDKYRWASKFVQERLSGYLHLICVQREFAGATKWLYPLLDYHFRKGHLPLIAGWPVNTEAFDRQLHTLQLLPRLAIDVAHMEGELELGFFCADPEGFEAMSFGYCFYWDANWNRRVLTSKEKRYLFPTLQIRLEGIQTEGRRQPRKDKRKEGCLTSWSR